MPHRVFIRRTGGPEVLECEEFDAGKPGRGQVRLRQEAAGVNFIDTQFRDGIYSAPLPLVLGIEGAGIIDALGPDVTALEVGDRVGYWLAFGGYADVRLVDADKLVRLPAGVPGERAAAVFTKGLSAWVMVKRAHAVRRGETVVVHAAAGGVGSLAAAWAASLGARVIATVGSAAKADRLRNRGFAAVLDAGDPDLAKKIKALSGGVGADVVYELVGAATFDRSVAALRQGGALVHFGNASGAPRVDLAAIARGAIRYSKPEAADFIKGRAALEGASADLWDALETGILNHPPVNRYPLHEARRAHEDIRGRAVLGSMVLTMQG